MKLRRVFDTAALRDLVRRKRGGIFRFFRAPERESVIPGPRRKGDR